MGKGDRRSRKGKIWAGSYGVTRKKKKKTHGAFVPKVKKAAPAKAAVAETEEKASKAKKAPAKKAAAPKKKAAPKKSEE